VLRVLNSLRFTTRQWARNNRMTKVRTGAYVNATLAPGTELAWRSTSSTPIRMTMIPVSGWEWEGLSACLREHHDAILCRSCLPNPALQFCGWQNRETAQYDFMHVVIRLSIDCECSIALIRWPLGSDIVNKL
jgi:hypothetical protein